MPNLADLVLQWPRALLLLLIPLGVLVWAWRRRQTARLRRTSVLDRWTLGLMASGMVLLVLALARPSASIWMPAPIDRLIIAIDSSGSMRADDVQPSRIEVARQTARRLIDAMPASAQVGVVSQAANAALVQAPTRDREALNAALDRLALQPGSALGSGIAVALAQLLPEAKVDVEALVGGVSRRSLSGDAPREPYALPDPPVEPGSRKDALLVVLADGDSNFGPDPRKIAEIAQRWGVRIYTVGIGTPQGVVLRGEGYAARVRLEEKTLREVAQISAGEYFAIGDQDAPARIYASLSGRIGLKKRRESEITALVAALGMLMVTCAALINIARTGRILNG